MNHEIVRYAKNKAGQKIGMLIAIEDGSHVNIGWSLCRPGDIFSRELGLNRAISNLGKPIPPSLEMDVKRFRVQCFLYFKSSILIHTPVVMERGLQPRKPRDGITRNSGHRKECQRVKGGKGYNDRFNGYGCNCAEQALVEKKHREVKKWDKINKALVKATVEFKEREQVEEARAFAESVPCVEV